MNNFRRLLLESKYENVWDLVDEMTKSKKFMNYHNPNAEYDDAIFEAIPLKYFLKHTGLKKSDIGKLNDVQGGYEATILVTDNEVSIFGGA